MADVAWAHGSLVPPATPVAPASLDDGTAAAVLDEAEAIINAVFGEVVADMNDKRKNKKNFAIRKRRKINDHRTCTPQHRRRDLAL